MVASLELPPGALLCTSVDFKNMMLKKIRDQYSLPLPATKLSPEIVMRTLSAYPHLIVVLEQRNKYMLFLTTFNSLRICVFVETSIDPIMFVTTSLWFSKDMHGDTLMSGEFDDGFSCFTLVDILGKGGMMFDRVNLCRRLWILNRILVECYRHKSSSICDFKTPRFYHYGELSNAICEAENRGNSKLTFKSMHLKFGDIVFDSSEEFHPPPPPRMHLRDIKKIITRKRGERGESGESGDSKVNDIGDSRVEDSKIKDSIIEDAEIEFPVEHGTQRTFWAAKVPRPDTYLLYDALDDSSTHRVAGITSLKLSLEMRSFFEPCGQDDKKRMDCVYNAKINRWIPLVG